MSLIASYLATRKAYYEFRKQGFGTRVSFFKALAETNLDISKFQAAKKANRDTLIRQQKAAAELLKNNSKTKEVQMRKVSKQIELFKINSYHGK